MNLGTFSLSLCVADLARSKDFYEKLGFSQMGGDAEQGWLILKGPSLTLGLFGKHIEKNRKTALAPFGLDNAQPVDEFTDVRELQKQLKAKGIEFAMQADESGEGPAHFVIVDPDGNPILIDQHR